MPAHVVCPTLSTMSSELLSGRPRAESGVDDDRYVRLLAVDPVLRSIARVDGLGPDRLRSLGLSRAKAAAIVGLARMHLDGTLDLDWAVHSPTPRAVQRCSPPRSAAPDRTYAAALLWASLRGGPDH